MAHNPLSGYVTSEYNPRRVHPVTGIVTVHAGIDIASGTGRGIVRAMYGGTVFRTGWGVFAHRSGNQIGIRNPDGEVQIYCHLQRIDVRTGQRVVAGQAIGIEGATGNVTGPHLHFETHYRTSSDRNGWGRHRNPRLDFIAAGITPGSDIRTATTTSTTSTPGGVTVSRPAATATQLKAHHERQGVYQQEVRDLISGLHDRLDAIEDRVGRTATAAQVQATYQRVRPSDLKALVTEALKEHN